MHLFFKDIVKGMYRRKKEILLLIAVEFFATLFVAAALLFQHNAETYKLESNRYLYGDWTIAEVIINEETQTQQFANHPYFAGYGMAVSGLPMVDEKGEKYAYNLGWLDETMLDIGHVALREGRFPENEHEIVMETGALTVLGCSFEVGQQIPLTLYDKSGNPRIETFELVGILKSSLSFWEVGGYMPGALVTKEVLDSADFKRELVCCYYLKDEYAGVDTAELFANLQEANLKTTWTGWRMLHNSKLYDASFWDGTELYASVEKMVLVLGMAAMSFLLAAYIQKRKKYYYDLRIIGMSKLRVKVVILWESLCASVPGAMFGIPGALLAGLFICGGITAAKNIGWFYEIPISLLGKALGMWFLIFVVSALIAMLMTGNRRLYSNSQSISLKFVPRWSLNKMRHTRRYSSIFIREHRMFQLRNLMGNVIGILFAVLLMFCGVELWLDYESYQVNTELLPDFRYTKSADTGVETGTYVWTIPELGDDYEGRSDYDYGQTRIGTGFSEQFFTALEDIPGVVFYTYGVRDFAHLFFWEGMQEDPYIVNQRNEETGQMKVRDENGEEKVYTNYMWEVLPENSLYFGYQSWFPHDTRKIFDMYYEVWGNEWMDYAAFEAGEQVFLLNNEDGLRIKDGDTLWIQAGEKRIEVQVAGVIPQTEVTTEYFPTSGGLALLAAMAKERGWAVNDLYLIGSEQLAKTIAKAEGSEFCYNWIDIKLNQFANYNLTVKQCTQLLSLEGASGNSHYEILQQELGELVNSLVMYGMFMALLVAFFMILRANTIQSGFLFQKERLKRLRMLGMEKRQLKKMNLLQGLYEARWVWLAVPLLYGVKAYRLWKVYGDLQDKNSMGIYLEELGALTKDRWMLLRYHLPEQVPLWVCLVVLVVMIGLHVLTRYLVSRGTIKAIDEDE